MPQIFKALASITAWTLFVAGWMFGITTTVMVLVGVVPEWERRVAFLGLAVASLILSVVAMKLRKSLE